MFRNYLLIAWRNLLRNKINSLVNIGGLSLGMASVIIIILWVKDEKSYDQFFSKADHIFQVNMSATDNGVFSSTGGNTAPAVGPTLFREYPEIASFARVHRPGDVMVSTVAAERAASYFTEQHVMAVDSNFLEIFNYPFLEGNAKLSLSSPESIVVTETIARKYFGRPDIIGHTLLLGTTKKPFTITGVLKNLPSQSSFNFDILVPINTYAEVRKRSWNWFWLQVNTYVTLKDEIAIDKSNLLGLTSKFSSMVRKHLFQRQEQSFEEFTSKGGRIEFSLQPFIDLHLYAYPLNTPARLTTLSNIRYVYIFSIVAFFIMLLACVNFMNMSTARAGARAREIGVRKVLGSLRATLIKQFLTEAMVFSVLASLIAVMLAGLLLPAFNQLTGKTLGVEVFFTGRIWIYMLLLCLTTGLLAGIYPAFYLTSFNPVQVLKGTRFKAIRGSQFIRNGLVVFQFSISIILIVCTLVVFKQLRFIQQRDLGMNRERMLIISNTDRLKNTEEVFRQTIGKSNAVVNASISSSIPTRVNFGDGYEPEQTENDKPLIKDISLSSFIVDQHFLPTFQMQLLQGRNFSEAFNDSATVILNETAARQIGWKKPVGQWLRYPGNSQRFQVIAVVKDFNVTSLRETVEPFALFYTRSQTYNLGHSYISVRLRGGDLNSYLHEIEDSWQKLVPNTPFDYGFLDNEFDALYRSEQSMGKVFGIFAFLSILIASLGMLGLTVYTIEQRMKEIGLRKILGASIIQVISLLSRQFLSLVCIACLLAFPLAWFAMHTWLRDFAFRTEIGWAVFAWSALATMAIAIVTIGFHAIKAGLANPVRILRTE